MKKGKGMTMKKIQISDEIQELINAKEQLHCARVAFDSAQPEYIEIAIEQLEVAEKLLDIAIKRAKLAGVSNDIILNVECYIPY